MFRRLLEVVLLGVCGCLIAGVYGALHDQISYTVSEEYFTCFKFYQFAIGENLWNRAGAGVVGFLATWWMGVFIGAFLIPAGMLVYRNKGFVRRMIEAFGVVAMTAFVIGVGALGVSFFTVNESALPEYLYPDSVTDKVSFARVGTMHNFSYLGGMAGIVTGIGYLVIRKKISDVKSEILTG